MTDTELEGVPPYALDLSWNDTESEQAPEDENDSNGEREDRSASKLESLDLTGQNARRTMDFVLKGMFGHMTARITRLEML